MTFHPAILWSTGVGLPLLLSSLLPLLSGVSFESGETFATSQPTPKFLSISYYICNAAAAGTFATACAPGLWYMWLTLLPDVRMDMPAFSLVALDVSWIGIFVFPHTQKELPHGFFTAAVMIFAGMYTHLSYRREQDRRIARWIQLCLFGQVCSFFVLGVTRGLVEADTNVGYWFFLGELLFLLCATSVAPFVLSGRRQKQEKQAGTGEDGGEAPSASTEAA